MELKLDFQSKVPIYVQIVDQVKTYVAGGKLQPGDQLPTVRELAADLRVNFNTVARAYRILHEERVISTQQGRGTYVLDRPAPETAAHRRWDRLMGMVEEWLAEAERLGYGPAEITQAWNERFEDWARGRNGHDAQGRGEPERDRREENHA